MKPASPMTAQHYADLLRSDLFLSTTQKRGIADMLLRQQKEIEAAQRKIELRVAE